ncbi:MAG: hypothetical protein J5714_00520 [Alphaproteobacteria bacterium]|nr:hypothetical protein [Alphaproteobacteria bacterium]
MKSKIILLVGMFACVSAYGETDYIDMQIQELEQRRDELKKQIAECEENTRGYKIAGIATLGATGVGVVGNIALHNEIKKIEQSKSGSSFVGGGAGGAVKTDMRSNEQKGKDECQTLYCIDFPDEALEYGCEC